MPELPEFRRVARCSNAVVRCSPLLASRPGRAWHRGGRRPAARTPPALQACLLTSSLFSLSVLIFLRCHALLFRASQPVQVILRPRSLPALQLPSSTQLNSTQPQLIPTHLDSTQLTQHWPPRRTIHPTLSIHPSVSPAVGANPTCCGVFISVVRPASQTFRISRIPLCLGNKQCSFCI
ncbi:hypothetical protein F4861DRAFT_237707 [Xylaria intraflava]|nr:hypothetical protein F4861DRAFT_237707 [Xylaria intraflava]